MRFTAIKQKLCLLILKLLGIDPLVEQRRMTMEKVQKSLADIGMALEIGGDLTVVDAEGNLK